MTSEVPEPLLTRKQVAAWLNVSVGWLEENKRIGPSYLKLNATTVRYEPSEVRAWLKQRKAP
jgi:hypothetical protein